MRQIVYVSSAATEFGDADLRQLMAVSVANNRASDISGMLLFHDGNFIQAIEGPDVAVARLFTKIGADPRHTHIIALTDREVENRSFGQWSMGLRQISNAELSADLGFTDYLARMDRAPGSAADIAWLLLDTYRRNLR